MVPILFALQVAATTSQSPIPEVEATVVEVSIAIKTESEVPVPGKEGSRTRYTIAGDKLRFDRIEGSSPQIMSASPDAYSISFNGGAGLLIVDSARKEYSRFDLGQMKQMMADMMSGLNGFDMKMTGSKFDVDSLGPGEPMFGYATQRWRTVQAFTVSMSMGTDSMAMSMENRTEALYAPAFEPLKQGMLQDQDSISLSMLPGLVSEELQRSMREAYAKLPNGMPIRSVATTTMMTGMMDITFTTTTEVTKIEKVRRPASFFEVPKGYKEVEPDLPVMEKPAQ
jgi:hypothetical protein